MEEDNEGEKHLPNSFCILCLIYHLALFSCVMRMVIALYTIISEHHKHAIKLNTEAKVCSGEQCVLAHVVNKVNGITTFKCMLMNSTESIFNL